MTEQDKDKRIRFLSDKIELFEFVEWYFLSNTNLKDYYENALNAYFKQIEKEQDEAMADIDLKKKNFR